MFYLCPIRAEFVEDYGSDRAFEPMECRSSVTWTRKPVWNHRTLPASVVNLWRLQRLRERTVLCSAAGTNTRPPGADMLALSGLSLALALALLPAPGDALKEGECEVCLGFLGKFYKSLQDNDVKFKSADIEKALIKTCRDVKGKENRFCYYIGATADAATKIINEVSKPLSYHAPVEKICEKLQKKDSQICELKYDKQLDLTTVDLKKLKVKDLKKILEEWDESCKGCAEKSDFIRKITELMPKYAPAAAKARTEL